MTELARKGNRKTEELCGCIPSPELCFAWYGTSDLVLPNWPKPMLRKVMLLVTQIQRLQHSSTVFVVATIQPHQHPKGFLTSKPCPSGCSFILSAQFTWLGIMFCQFDLHLYILCEEQNKSSSCPWTKWLLSCFLLNMSISTSKKHTMTNARVFPLFRWVGGAVLASMPSAQEAQGLNALESWLPLQIVFVLSIQAKQGSIKVLPV